MLLSCQKLFFVFAQHSQPLGNFEFKITLSNWSWIARNEFADHEVVWCCQCQVKWIAPFCESEWLWSVYCGQGVPKSWRSMLQFGDGKYEFTKLRLQRKLVKMKGNFQREPHVAALIIWITRLKNYIKLLTHVNVSVPLLNLILNSVLLFERPFLLYILWNNTIQLHLANIFLNIDRNLHIKGND